MKKRNDFDETLVCDRKEATVNSAYKKHFGKLGWFSNNKRSLKRMVVKNRKPKKKFGKLEAMWMGGNYPYGISFVRRSGTNLYKYFYPFKYD